MEYEDFSIKIEPRQGDSYPVIVLRSPAGEGRSSFTPPFDLDQLAQAASTLDQEVRTRRPALREASPGATASLPMRLGDQLFNALFSGVVRSLFDRSLGMMQVQQRGLRIKLHIDPEEPSLAPLMALPWEFLYRRETREFLNLSRFTPILRDLDVQRPYLPLVLQPPLRILVFAADPIDYPRLDLEREQTQMEGCLGRLQGVQADYLPHATITALQERLGENVYHVLHYMGHGGFDEESGRGVLLLENEQGCAQRADGGTLSVLLHDFSDLRLVFLNACETARLASEKGLDPFAGVASALVMAGIPAVVAMQFPISDRAAITFAQRFYGLLARGQPVDAAVAEGRRAVRMAEPETLEWGTPVLFTSAPDGVIFTLATQPAKGTPAAPVRPPVETTLDADQQARLEKLYNDGLEAFWLEDWVRAAACLRQVAAEKPDYQDVQDRLQVAERHQELQTLYTAAETAQAAGDWEATIVALEQIEQIQPGYKDVPARLQAARQSARLADLYDEARRLCQGARWQAAVKVFDQIHQLQPDYPDPEDLLSKAQAEAATQQQTAELEKLYQRGLNELNARRWLEAAALLAQLQALRPDFRQVEALLTRAQTEQRKQQQEQDRQQVEHDKTEQIDRLYREAQGALADGRYDLALAKLAGLRALAPEFDDTLGVESKAQAGQEQAEESAEQQQRLSREFGDRAPLAEPYLKAVDLLKAGDPKAALEAWEAIHNLDPLFPDRQNVAGNARQALDQLARQGAGQAKAEKKSRRLPRWVWFVGGGLLLLALLVGGYFLFRGSPAAPVPSTQGMIAFHSNRTGSFDLYLMSADGRQLAQLTDTPYDEFDPAISPDGTKIAYTSPSTGNGDIYLLDLATGETTQLTREISQDLGPAWSPDGKRLAFTADLKGNFDIFTIGIDGQSLTQLTYHPEDEIDPAWSPDGGQILFIFGMSEGKQKINMISSTGGDLVTGWIWEGTYAQPAWSPDGRSIALIADFDFIDLAIWKYKDIASGGDEMASLTDDPAVDQSPSWSPDGNSLAYNSDRSGNGEIYTINIQSGESSNLTNKASDDGGPSWGVLSAAGKAILESGSMPIPPTPQPDVTAPVPVDETIYDNFDNPKYDGAFNPELWKTIRHAESSQVAQANGKLLMSSRQENHQELLGTAQGILLDAPYLVEASVKVDPISRGIAYLDVLDATYFAGLEYDVTQDVAVIYSTSNDGIHGLEKFAAGEWHTLGIKIDPGGKSFYYYLDGNRIGSHPFRTDRFRFGSYFTVQIGVGVWTDAGWTSADGPVEGYFDDVRIYAAAPEPIQPSPTAASELPAVITDEQGAQMALVPAGEFTMGSDSGDENERPAHQVYLDDYYIDLYEVTNRQYSFCLVQGPCAIPELKDSNTRSVYFGDQQYDEYPMIGLSWGQAQTYCEWRGAHLPTEAEWEKAARGTDDRTYPWGDEITCDYANYFNCTTKDTTQVGSYPDGASPYGLFDMAGNVWEWVSSAYWSYPYSPDDGREYVFSQDTRVLRGGSWNDHSHAQRTVNRLEEKPSAHRNDVGFRCARSP